MTQYLTVRNTLIATAVALAIGLGFETDWGNGLGTPNVDLRNAASRGDAVSILPDFRLTSDASTYSQIVERPLLNPSRKPAPTQVAQAAPEAPKPQVRRGLYQLIGVSDFGNGRIAQVRELASNRVRSVREGDLLQELTVKKVESNQIVLAFQGETDVLEMAKFTASGRVPPPPAPPVVAAPPVPPQATQPAAAAVPQPQQPVAAAPAPITAPPAGSASSAAAPPTQRVFPNGLVVPEGARDPSQPREVVSVGEMLERRRQARQQAGSR